MRLCKKAEGCAHDAFLNVWSFRVGVSGKLKGERAHPAAGRRSKSIAEAELLELDN